MIIEIQSSCAKAQIDSYGAQLISLIDKEGTEYIWQREPSLWDNCSPILFPIIGNSRNNITIVEGTPLEIPKHGYCKTSSFEVTEQSSNRVVFSFDDTAVPAGGYPYRFRFFAEYELCENTLKFSLTVKNQDTKDIFYCIGIHPGFRCPLLESESFEDYVLRFEKAETNGYRTYDSINRQYNMNSETFLSNDQRTIPLTHELFSEDALWFDRPVSRCVSFVNPATEKGVRMSFEGFDTIAFWTLTAKDASFICLEPWNGSAICSDEDDLFLHKNHLQKLAPKDSAFYGSSITIL